MIKTFNACKKSAFIFFILITILLSSCSKNNTPYNLNRTKIKEIRGTTQMTTPVKTVSIPKESFENFFNKTDALQLKSKNKKNDIKGWQYYFVITYENGETVSISLLENQATIDGYAYNMTNYNADDFSVFFN